MLKKDDLKKSTVLSTLTDEQLEAIQTLSANDEQVVIHAKRGEFYNDRDADIYAVFGVEKLPQEKATDYFKRSAEVKISEATKAASDKLKKIEAEKADLEKQIADGNGSEAIKRKLADKDSEIESWKAKYTTDIEAKNKEVTDRENMLKTTTAKAELDKAKIGLKFKPDELFPKAEREFYINSIDNAILAELTPDKDESTGKTIWRDTKGEIVRSKDPNKHNSPIEIAEIYAQRLLPVLDQDRKVTGTGGKGSETRTNTAGLPIISAKSQVDASEQITKHLLQKGVERGTPQFDLEFKAVKEANPEIAALPFQE